MFPTKNGEQVLSPKKTRKKVYQLARRFKFGFHTCSQYFRVFKYFMTICELIKQAQAASRRNLLVRLELGIVNRTKTEFLALKLQCHAINYFVSWL